MEKLDLKKEYKELYNAGLKAAKAPVMVKVPKFKYLMYDGKGDPNTSQEFQDAMMALYGTAYTLKFMCKLGPVGKDWGVMPLQALWWSDDMNDFRTGKKENWMWTCMILQPDFVTKKLVEEAMEQLREKKDPPGLDKLRFDSYSEGKAGQILHIGPYAEEGPTIEKLHHFILDKGYTLEGKHHEIYLSDPRRTKPEKLKTIIRQPVKKA